MSSNIRCFIHSLTAIALAASTIRADHADQHAWTGLAGDGLFETAGNWDPAGPPGEDDVALFDLDAIYTIAFGANHTNDRLLVRDGEVTLHLFTGTVFGTPRTYTLTNADESIVVGQAGGDEAALTLRLGTLDSATASIGLEAGSTGDVLVTAGAFWTSSGSLYVGNEGTGRLTIDNGTVTNTDSLQLSMIGRLANSDGTVTVTGGNSAWNNSGWMLIGGAGTGTLIVEEGGGVSSATGRVGNASDGEGLAIVRDEGSQWNNDGNLLVGNFGEGELRILIGGNVTNTAGVIGWASADAEGTVDVRGQGATWTNDGTLTIGGFGTGTLAISDGGAVESTGGRIGFADGSRGTVLVTSEGSAWTISGELRVGEEGNGTLTVTDGGRVENTIGRIGADAGSDGSVTVRDEGASWINSDQLFVGEEGDGTLRIEDGGHVQSSTSTVGRQADAEGMVIVSGADAEWTVNGTLNVGNFGTAEMTIEDGGHVSNTASGRIALNSGSDGTVTVTGQDSSWTSDGNVEVGGSGDGTLAIEAGGSVSGALGQIAVSANSEGTALVSGENSSWTSSQSLIVGDGGTATLTISGGGVSNTSGLIGHMSGSTGTVMVSGTEATWTNSFSTRVGEEGVGTLAIEAGGRVSTGTDGTIGRFGDSTGTVTVSGAGSAWTIEGQLGIGGNPALGTNGGEGALTINAGGSVSIAEETVLFPDALLRLEGGTLSTAAVEFQGGGQFQWTGGTLHVDTYHGDLVNQAGTLAPGRSAGTTTILGDYTQQAAAALELEIGGLLAGSEHDLVSITGNAILGGELQLALLDDFLPNAGDQFTVLSVLGGIAGVFSNVTTGQRLETVDGLGSFLVHYGPGSAFSPNQIVLTGFEAATIPGDFTGDGVVDAADYTVWRDGLGGPFVEADYDVWKQNFGATAESAAALDSSSHAAVPEPGSGALLLLAAAMLAASRRRRSTVARCRPQDCGEPRVGSRSPRRARFLLISCCSLVPGSFLMMSAPGRADTFEFVLGANNLFSSENNWSPAGGPPGPNDVAEFTADAVYNVNFQDSPTNFWLRVHNGEVTFRPVGLPADVLRTYSVTSAEIDGGSLIMTGNQARRIAVNNTSDGNMNVGMSQSGSLTITEGATLESSVVALGTFASGQGAITVSGEGSQWVNNSSIFVGVQGRGELTVAEGAAFTNNVTLVIGQLTDSFGQVTLSESSVSSQGLLVGQSGTGTLTITEGANLESLTATLGSSAGSQGTVTVTGAGSTWISQSSLRLAGSTSPGGSALLTIANGGLVETAGQLRLFPQATATIDGGTLRVGSFDKQGGVLDWIDGTLHVTGDAGLTVGNGPFADFLALSSSQHLIVDHQLAVEPGAVFLARSPLTTGSLANNGALILYNNLVSADDLTNNGNLILEGNTVDGPVTNAADGTITVFGEVTFNDLVDGPGGFYGPGTTVFTGGYTPGASPAAVPFEGSVRFSDSNTLTIELAGLTPGDEHDQLFIGGDAMLDGSLLVELLDGFTPGFNQQFTILDVAGTLTGQFAGLDEGALVGTFGGTDLFITYAAGDGNNVALFTPGLPGDFNNDGVVDAADYTVWRDGLGAEFDAADYDDWQNNFGATAPPGSGASQLAAVPEPTSAALVVCALIASFTVLAKRRS